MHIINDFSSPNYSPRVTTIKYIVLHYTEMPFKEALTKLTDPASKVSCHYLIKENGEILQLVTDDKIAWHAGESSWMEDVQLNQNSIGIEMDNLGHEEFPLAQIHACIDLCHYLVKKHQLNPANIVGHSDIAFIRKIDPGIFFDWQLLATKGLGIWHNIEYSKNLATEIICEFGQHDPKVEELQQGLRKIGYKISPSGHMDTQTNFAIRAFQGRFCPQIITAKGGINYYRNLESIYNWDAFSNQVLQKLLGF